MRDITVNRSDSSNSVPHPPGPTVGIASTVRNGNNRSGCRVKGVMIPPILLPVENRKIEEENCRSPPTPTLVNARRLWSALRLSIRSDGQMNVSAGY